MITDFINLQDDYIFWGCLLIVFTKVFDMALRYRGKNVTGNNPNEPDYVLVERVETSGRFVKIPLQSRMGKKNRKYHKDYKGFDKSPCFPMCMESYDRGVSNKLSMNLVSPLVPSMSSLRAKAKLQDVKDFRKAVQHILNGQAPVERQLEHEGPTDFCRYDKCCPNQPPSNTIACQINTGKSRLFDSGDSLQNVGKGRLFDSGDKYESACKGRLFDSVDTKMTKKGRLFDSGDPDSSSDNENVSRLKEDPFDEEVGDYLSYEEELNLIHLMDDSGKIVWDNYNDEEEFESLVGTDVESIRSISQEEYKAIDQLLIKNAHFTQYYLILETAPSTDHHHA